MFIFDQKNETMNLPENLKFTKDHEWVLIEGNTAPIGITDFAQGELGEIVYVEQQPEGETLDKEEVFGTIEAVKTVSDLFMPLSGEITEFNSKLEENPEAVNENPYADGWMIKMTISNPEEIVELLDAEAYKALIG